MAHDIFISYSSQNRETANAVCAALEQRGITCWIDHRDISPGQDYAESIITAINDAPIFLLLLSAHSNASAPVAKEVERANHKHKHVLVLRLDSTSLSPALEYHISNVQHLNATTAPLEPHLERLVEAVQRWLSGGLTTDILSQPSGSGSQTNIAGEVAGPILSGQFQGPVNAGDIQAEAISGTGIAIGHGAQSAVNTGAGVVAPGGVAAGQGGTAVGGDLNIIQYPQSLPQVTEADIAAANAKFATMPLEVLPPARALPSGSHLPFARNPLFTGRVQALQQLASLFQNENALAITGLGGLGKTQLAVEFAHRYGDYFPGGVFWMSFARADDVKNHIAQCGGARGMPVRADYDTLKLDEQVAWVMREWQSALPRLLIFDNCESEELFQQWRPSTGGARILITSRKAEWDIALGVRVSALEVLPRTESVALLQKFRPDLSGLAGLNDIAAEVGDLPLALHLVGSYLKALRFDVRGRGQPTALLEELQHRGLEHSALQGERGGLSPTGHERHVARTFDLSYHQLNPADPVDGLALRALSRAACFEPGEFIPRELLLTTLELADDEAWVIEDALTRLNALGLLALDETSGDLRLHRLLGKYTHHQNFDPQAARRFTATLAQFTLTQAQDFDRLHAYLPHLLRAVDQAQPLEQVELMSALIIGARTRPPQPGSSYFKKRGHTAEYLKRFDVAIRAARELGLEWNETLHYLLGRRGDAYAQQDQLEAALRAYEESLAIAPSTMREVVLLCAIGLALGQQEQNAEALAYLQKAETTARASPDQQALLYVLEYRSSFAGQHNDFQNARYYAEEAVQLNQKLGDRIGEGWALLNLGSATFDLGETHQALIVHQEALKIAREVGELGLQARVLHALGGDVHALKHPEEEALVYFSEALKLYDQIGDLHNQQRLKTFLTDHHYPPLNF